MGGDHAPREIVRGAVLAARELGIRVALVGQPALVEAELAKNAPRPEGISLVPAGEVIAMDEHPAQAAATRRTPRRRWPQTAEEGRGGGFRLGGEHRRNAGASNVSWAASRDRAAFTQVSLPLSGRLTVMLDIGANADCKAKYLLQFAEMGSVYMQRVWKVERPRVALLSIGEEETKGTQLAQEAYALLKQAKHLNFVGNVEGRDVPAGVVDVIVTDGFTGNVVVKTMEGVANFIRGQIEGAIKGNPIYWLPGLALRGAFRGVQKKTDYREYGAGPLLGVNGLVFVAHGRSDALAIKSSLRVAREAVLSGMLEALRPAAGREVPSPGSRDPMTRPRSTAGLAGCNEVLVGRRECRNEATCAGPLEVRKPPSASRCTRQVSMCGPSAGGLPGRCCCAQP
jgi:glycerol-3-phosphate acyltransferase PlsX